MNQQPEQQQATDQTSFWQQLAGFPSNIKVFFQAKFDSLAVRLNQAKGYLDKYSISSVLWIRLIDFFIVSKIFFSQSKGCV